MIKNLLHPLKQRPWILTIFLVFLLLPYPSLASTFPEIIGNIIYYTLFWPFVLLMKLEMLILPIVYQYSDFVREENVVSTWKIMRDLANMFFIIMLLLMSFATILQIKGYGYKNLLSRILIMAILVNFSRTILGLLVDFVQFIMLTFVAAWKDVAAGEFQSALGLYHTLNLNAESLESGGSAFMNFISAVFLGGIMLIIAVVVIGIFIVMILFRIVTLWILTILSPLAFVANAYPQTKKYYNEWEQELTKSLIIGPALAFFLWLTFTIVGDGNISTKIIPGASTIGSASVYENNQGGGAQNPQIDAALGGPTKATSIGSFLNYVVAIALLMAGLKFASQSGTAGAGLARSGLSKLESYATKAKNFAGAKTIGRVEGMYAAGGVIGGAPLKLAGGIGSRWVDERGQLKPGRGGGTRKAISGALLGLPQGLAIRARTAREQVLAAKAEAATKGMTPERKKAYLQARVGTSKFGKGVRTVLTFGGARDYAPAAANELAKQPETLDYDQAEGLVGALQAGGYADAIKNLQARFAGLYDEASAERAVKAKRENVMTTLTKDGILNENGAVREGFRHLYRSLMDPVHGIMGDEIRTAMKKMTKQAKKAADDAIKQIEATETSIDMPKVPRDHQRFDYRAVGDDGKLGGIQTLGRVSETDPTPKPEWKINKNDPLIKHMSMLAGADPMAAAELIEKIFKEARKDARNEEEGKLFDHEKAGLKEALWEIAAKSADYESLGSQIKDPLGAGKPILVRLAKYADMEKQKQFYTKHPNQDLLKAFAEGVLLGGNKINAALGEIAGVKSSKKTKGGANVPIIDDEDEKKDKEEETTEEASTSSEETTASPAPEEENKE